MERSIIMAVNAVITGSGTFSRKAPIAERDRDRIIGQTSETTLERTKHKASENGEEQL